MFKKLFAWVKSLFVPLKFEQDKIDEFIAKQSQTRPADVTLSPPVRQPVETKLEEDEVVVGFDGKFVEVRKVVVAKKSLDEQLEGVTLPAYARGKKLPPKAKKQYIAQSKQQSVSAQASSNRTDTDVVAASTYGYVAASAASEPYTSSVCSSSNRHSSSDDSYSYDSGSSSSDSSSSSCD